MVLLCTQNDQSIPDAQGGRQTWQFERWLEYLASLRSGC